jgi:protein required for attachment to host cells
MGLYVPAGFPHTTDTVHTSSDVDSNERAQEEEEVDSVHVTVGLDTHIWGLTLGAMANGLMASSQPQQAQQPGSSASTAAAAMAARRLGESLYWNSFAAVPKCLGFLRQHFHPKNGEGEGEGVDSEVGSGSGDGDIKSSAGDDGAAREAAVEEVLAARAALDTIGASSSSSLKALTPAIAKAAVIEVDRHLSSLLEVP